MKGGEEPVKKTLVTTLAVGVITTGVLGAGSAYAQTPTTDTGTKPFYSSLIDKIAATFNLDRAKVETVVTTWHTGKKTERMNMMRSRFEERLTQAVKDGKITEAQKTAIINKMKEEKANLKPDDLKNMTPEERHAAMEKKRTELEEWAGSQGIDPRYLGVFKMRHGGPGGEFKMKIMN